MNDILNLIQPQITESEALERVKSHRWRFGILRLRNWRSKMPIPLSIAPTEISRAIETALVKERVVPEREEAVAGLKDSGLDPRQLAIYLANLIMSAKDATKLNAIRDAFALYGINLRPEAIAQAVPSITFNVIGENTQLNNLFAPERNFD